MSSLMHNKQWLPNEGFSTFVTSATIFVPQGNRSVPSVVYRACGTVKCTKVPACEHFEKYFSSKTNCNTLPRSTVFLRLVIVTTLQGAFLWTSKCSIALVVSQHSAKIGSVFILIVENKIIVGENQS